MPPRFITALQLRDRLATGTPTVLLDVRHLVGTDRQRGAYDAGHIPGAVYVELRDELAGPPSPGRGGRNPLPTAQVLQSNLRRWGVAADLPVVVYAGAGQPAAGRAWWVLTWAGVPGVRILAGGYEAWVDAGLPVSTATPVPTPTTFTIRPGCLREVALGEVPAHALRGQLVDVRPHADFDQGHIPNAINLPYTDLTDAAGLPLPARRLHALLAERGVDPGDTVALTCGGGVAAAWSAALFDEAGIRTALHVGSWSEWVAHNPVPRQQFTASCEPALNPPSGPAPPATGTA
ncbi:MAG: rhodanese-like domain-containing protein [Xenophilus sp.]